MKYIVSLIFFLVLVIVAAVIMGTREYSPNVPLPKASPLLSTSTMLSVEDKYTIDITVHSGDSTYIILQHNLKQGSSSYTQIVHDLLGTDFIIINTSDMVAVEKMKSFLDSTEVSQWVVHDTLLVPVDTVIYYFLNQCRWRGDISGDGQIDIVDLSMIVDILWNGAPEPCSR